MLFTTAAILEKAQINSDINSDYDVSKTPSDKLNKPYVPEGSQKRDLSPGSTPSPSIPTQQDKRHRHDSIEFDWGPAQAPDGDMEAEPTLLDIMAQLKLTAKVSDLVDVAKKDDIVKLQDTLNSHAIDILQLKEDVLSQSKRIQQLEESLGRQTAAAYRTQPDVFDSRRIQHGAALSKGPQQDNRRKNLVFEGIPNMSDRETISYIVQLCSVLNIVAYDSDFEAVVRMRRRDDSIRPPPALVTFDQLHIRSAILRKKASLIDSEKYSSIFINLDEPVEIRRAKAVFRRIGYKAKQDGRNVQIRDDWIMIDDEQYKLADIDRIPDKYRVDVSNPSKAPTLAMDSDPTKRLSEPQGGARPKVLQEPVTSTRSTSFRREKIKLTKAGLTFSGPTAFLSHLFRCSFVYGKVPYTSVEQGYHHTHALVEEDHEIASAIINTDDVQRIKDLAKDLPKSEKWLEMSPDKMWELDDAKFSQNPELLDKLIDTVPHKLIEASVDSKWGGACPFGSDIYEQGQVPGSNICGEQLTKYRDMMIERRSQPMST